MINSCQVVEVTLPLEVERAAERLACLLVDTEAFQGYARCDRAFRMDSVASELLHQMNAAENRRELSRRLEALPVVAAFRGAAQGVGALFGAVDESISAAAGLPFAEYAASASGST